ncbi:MAG: DDE-type integrase/transposase/recombinase, partial [Candidatus Thiodiazotropha taylori]|nr:DDE-type integrase/transposase/recombinase [Candidatus Thiodiazotropha taylori]
MVKRSYGLEKTVPLMINDINIRAEPDTGADANVMDEYQYRALLHRSDCDIKLQKCDTKLRTLQNVLPVKGEFEAVLRNQTCGKRTKFLVIKGRINSPPLISKTTLMDLGMLQIRENGTFATSNDLRIPETTSSIHAVDRQGLPNEAIDAITRKFSNIFEGIGKIKDVKNDKELYVQFSIKQNTVPVAQRPRPVPYYLQKPLKMWLDQCVADGIYEPVPTDDPITWCSPIVVQPKPKYLHVPNEELQPNMIRACIDLRIPNKFMDRTRITQAPVVEDFIYKFHDCVVFSKLDLRSGYHQLMLHPDSRAIVTFSTPWGNFRPKRLIFGAKASQDVFDEMMFRIFGDIPMCLNQRDDILIGGRNLAEHNETLEKVFKRAQDFGVTFNLEKCQFGVEQLEFYGYRFTKHGLKPTLGKVRAIKESGRPESKEAVKSFLGMTGYLSKFIPRYASLTAPLRELTKTEVRFHWGENEQKAFENLKASISSEDTMVFFNPNKPIIVRTEASYHDGLSAGLFQDKGNGLQPVHFISRTMTETEKRYSQTEKDALAVRWAKNRFRMYLLGAPKFKIVTGHKPLISMFNKANAKLPPRIERWVMDMQDVDFELVYEPGKDEQDPLDFLSRHPLAETGTDNTEKIIKNVINAEHAVVLDRIRKETRQDRQLQKLYQRILKEDWEKYRRDHDINQFYSMKDELFVIDGLIFRLNQIVIPEKLQQSVIKAAHSLGHLGMTKTKQMLRHKYWFPEMNKRVETLIGQCFECQVTTKEHRKEPLRMTEIPEKPWQVVSVDFGGPYPDGHLNLVIIDKRTRYPEVETVNTTSMKSTKEKLKKVFATHGTPEVLETDNGPPFNAKEFAEFAEEEGFRHHRITPLHPRANGEAENFMKLLNKTEQRARL